MSDDRATEERERRSRMKHPVTTDAPRASRLRTTAAVTDTASVLLCDNPGLLTLEGTNTWILRASGSDEFVVVDPGPDDAAHIERHRGTGKVALVLISHRHGDHTDGIDKIVDATGATVRSVGSGFLRGSAVR